MELDTNLVILLISTGVIVGVINTYAGAAAAISISIFMALGLPITVANGTNRIPVLAQTLVMSVNFARQGILDYRVGLKLAIPAVVGSIIGSFFASLVDVKLFSYILTFVLVFLLLFLILNPKKITKNRQFSNNMDADIHRIRKIDYLWFFIIGLYGGAIHIGVGYLILAITMMHMGYDVITANALKGFVVLMYVPFALSIFIYNDQVVYSYGIVHAIGNIIGAFIATQFAQKINKSLIRWLLIFMIIFTILDINGVVNVKGFIFRLFGLQ